MGSIGSERALEGAPVAYVWPSPDLQADFSELVDQSAVMYYGPGAFALAMMEIRALGWDLFCLHAMKPHAHAGLRGKDHGADDTFCR